MAGQILQKQKYKGELYRSGEFLIISLKFLKKYRASCTNYGMLHPNQISSTAIHLLSDFSNAINGQNIIIDDGWSL